ncbi:heavy-metal-associated domain-containing protein [Saccharomonospora xinjiangensis]|uniref:Copper chaperone n=1 Tax=Saccharomonospora xinjiangensis XJ-54 TaxID=882086 RepID=I0UWY5_9PSEU|nr:heavy metal-associated domain-containing protein [Saccharomonospora xinjiangensis]EID52388.1 copper chaperone [Saccharomonospora xinjiangensis XJ-54]
MSDNVYTVKGMTCSGCMTKVTNAVTSVAGVDDVDIDITTGEVTVLSTTPVDGDLVREAINKAGYEVAG